MNKAMKTLSRALVGIALGAFTLALAGCADPTYPTLGNITKIADDKIMTPEQRAAAMKEMAQERDRHGAAAVKEIEKR